MPTAKRALLEISTFIDLDNPVRTISFIDEILETMGENIINIFVLLKVS